MTLSGGASLVGIDVRPADGKVYGLAPDGATVTVDVKETTSYDLDAMAGTLLKQAPPNDGVLATVGGLGVKITGPVAFDVWTDGMGKSVGWLMSGGTLHTVDLTTGAAMVVGPIAGLKGTITDIAILPAM